MGMVSIPLIVRRLGIGELPFKNTYCVGIPVGIA